MPGRRQQHAGLSARTRWTAATIGVTLATAAVSAAVLSAGPANASTKPAQHYHPGSDTATFTATGVLDHNCLVSTGGTSIYIKPGDKIKFNSSLVGISVGDALAGKTLGGLLNTLLQPSMVAGLNVSAKIHSGSATRTVHVTGGKSATVPASALHAGKHKITWTATGLSLLPSLNKAPIPLSSDALKSGAKLSWSGTIFVTKGAPKCTLTVATPKAKVSVGPVKVTVPPVKVTVPGVKLPNKLPSVGNLLPKKPGGTSSSTSPKKAHSSAPKPTKPTYKYTPPAMSVPEQVVPRGDTDAVYTGGGYALGVLPDTGSQRTLSAGSEKTTKHSPIAAGRTTSVQQVSTGKQKTVDLASSTQTASPTGELPVILAILAVMTLAMVAGVYARLYLLGQKK